MVKHNVNIQKMQQLNERIEKTQKWELYHINKYDCIMSNQIAIMQALIDLKKEQEPKKTDT